MSDMELPTYGEAECRHCEEVFVRLTTEQVYCTQKCRWNWWHYEKMRRREDGPRIPMRMCRACDDWFVPWQLRQRFCSTHCGKVFHWAEVRRICSCTVCGRLVFAARRPLYCGKRCLRIARLERKGDSAGFVYFIQAESGGPIKIGRAADPDKRLYELQCGNPSRLVLLGTIEGGSLTEHRLHRQFSRHRLQGEWFEPVPDILALTDDRPQLRLVA